ncbi:MAG: DUF971 domain-containing protein [Zetaproteobacteria bacterium]|nr:DUF971 domain-containing protein [Zetaproteobacteria bacterium]
MVSGLQIREIWQEDTDTLMIHWSTGEHMAYDVGLLREECPCAACRDEITGVRLYAPRMDQPKVRPHEIASVGSYALKITFDDLHSSGLYSFAGLYDLGKRQSMGVEAAART